MKGIMKLATILPTILLITSTLSAAAPSGCGTKIFVDLYPAPACVILAAGQIQLCEVYFLSPGACQDTTQGIQSFRQAINNDAAAQKCTLKAFTGTGCTGESQDFVPNVEQQENTCVNYDLGGGVTALAGARSLRLDC